MDESGTYGPTDIHTAEGTEAVRQPVELDAGEAVALLDTLQGVAVLAIDRDLRYVAAGGTGLVQVGWNTDELIGRSLTDPETGQVRAIQCTTRDITRRHRRAADR